MKGHRRKVLPLVPLMHQPEAIGVSPLDFVVHRCGGHQQPHNFTKSLM